MDFVNIGIYVALVCLLGLCIVQDKRITRLEKLVLGVVPVTSKDVKHG